MRIELEEDKEQNSKTPKGGSAVAEERQRNTDNGKKTDRHSDIYGEVKKQNARHRVAVDPREFIFLPLGQEYDPQKECHEQGDREQAADPSVLFSNGAENKVCALFGDEIELCLRALKKPLAHKSSAPDRDL